MEQADYNKAIVSKLDTTQAKQKPKRETKRQSNAEKAFKVRLAKEEGSRRQRITESMAEQIAGIVAKGLNESEACAILGIKRESWFNWKHINKSRCDDIFTRIRAAKIKSCLDAIDQAGDGKTIETPSGETIVVQRADWRAKGWLLERAIAPERFREQQQQASPLPAIAVEILSELSAKVFATKPPEAILDAQEVKALPAGDAGDRANG